LGCERYVSRSMAEVDEREHKERNEWTQAHWKQKSASRL
jgi:hypothetical protein